MAKYTTAKELHKKNGEQLSKLLSERREELRHTRFQHASRSIKNQKTMLNLRKEIARIQTVLQQKKTAPVEEIHQN